MMKNEINTQKVESVDISESADLALTQEAALLMKANAEHLDINTLQSLALARARAVEHLAALEQAKSVHQSGNILQWLGDGFERFTAAPKAVALAFAMALVTFFAAQQFNFNDDLKDSDAYLLASELPPEAFSDKGFNAWLVSARD